MTEQAKFPGVYFAATHRGIEIAITRRADLIRGRMHKQAKDASDLDRSKRLAAKQGRQIDRSSPTDLRGVIDAPTIEKARMLRRVLAHVFCASGSGNTLAVAQVVDALMRCRRMGLTVHFPGIAPKEHQVAGHQPIIEQRVLPEPLMSRGELLHQLEAHKAGPKRLQPGYRYAGVNMAELIGGLAAVTGKTEAQVLGAAHYRRVAGHAQMGGARAVDYEQVKVDTSGPTESAVIEVGADARREYYDATKRLRRKPMRLAVAERVILQGESISATAKALALGQGGTARQKVTSIVLDAADELAGLFGYLPPPRSRIRRDGDAPTVAETRRAEPSENS